MSRCLILQMLWVTASASVPSALFCHLEYGKELLLLPFYICVSFRIYIAFAYNTQLELT